LKLYVTGRTPRAEQAAANLRRICEENLQDHEYQITIIDVLEQPHLAEEDRIIATPTLIKLSPQPQRRIIGDLSNREKVLFWLSIQASAPEEA
jgi:circadian clock protein KaiB